MKPIHLSHVMLAVLASFYIPSSAHAETKVKSINPSYPGEQYEVTEEKLQQFHDVQQKVQQVKEKYRLELLKAGPNQAAAASAIQRGNAEIAKVVGDSEMSMDEYNQLSTAIKENRKVQQNYQRIGK